MLTLTHSKHTKCAGAFNSVFLPKRGLKNKQVQLKKHMVVSRETPAGAKYSKMGKECGAVLATKDHQGGLDNKEDE